MLIDIFERIGYFFARLETYTKVPLTREMAVNMAQITVEMLDILATATKDMKQSGASKSDLRFRFRGADIVVEKFLKKAIGQTDMKDGLKKLDKLTSEGATIANAEMLRVAPNIYHGGKGINKNVKGIEINEKMQTIISKQHLFSESSAPSLTSPSCWRSKIVDGVDDIKRL